MAMGTPEEGETTQFMNKRMQSKKKKKLGSAALNPGGYKGKMSFLNYVNPSG
jgi:hypothetical protein